MEYTAVLFEIKNRIAHITLNRPDKLNALNERLKEEFNDALDRAEASEEVLGVIITGAGKSFSAGADLSEVEELKKRASQDGTKEMRRKTHELYLKLYSFPKITVAAVNGYAFGGGAELCLCCDFRIAGERAVFGMPEAKMGLMPGFGGTQMLPRVIQIGAAKEILLSGRNVSPEEGVALGLYSEIHPQENLAHAAEAFLVRIIQNGPVALRCIKRAVDKGIELPIQEAFALEAELCSIPSDSKDAQEGTAAFREKRKPVFRNE